MIDLQPARSFVAVVREGSVSRAARRLFRSQPTVTLSVKRLERLLGARLLERAGRGVRPTRAGRLLFDLLAPLLEQWESAEARFLEDRTGAPSGLVRLAADAVSALYLVPAVLRTFGKRNPRVAMTVRECAPADALELVRRGAADAAVVPAFGSAPGVEARVFCASPRLLVAPRHHPLVRASRLRTESLAGEGFVLPAGESPTRTALERALGRAGFTLRVVLETGGWEASLRYVGLGLGIAVVPAFCVERSDRRLAARPLTRILGREMYAVAWKAGEPAGATVTSLVAAFGGKGA